MNEFHKTTRRIADQCGRNIFAQKAPVIRSNENLNVFHIISTYYFQVESEFSVLMPNRLPKIIVLKHCQSDAQGVQSSYYANGLDIGKRLNKPRS